MGFYKKPISTNKVLFIYKIKSVQINILKKKESLILINIFFC